MFHKEPSTRSIEGNKIICLQKSHYNYLTLERKRLYYFNIFISISKRNFESATQSETIKSKTNLESINKVGIKMQIEFGIVNKKCQASRILTR